MASLDTLGDLVGVWCDVIAEEIQKRVALSTIQRIELREGDRLLVRCPADDERVIPRLKAFVERWVPPGVEVIVTTDDIEFTVIGTVDSTTTPTPAARAEQTVAAGKLGDAPPEVAAKVAAALTKM